MPQYGSGLNVNGIGSNAKTIVLNMLSEKSRTLRLQVVSEPTQDGPPLRANLSLKACREKHQRWTTASRYLHAEETEHTTNALFFSSLPILAAPRSLVSCCLVQLDLDPVARTHRRTPSKSRQQLWISVRQFVESLGQTNYGVARVRKCRLLTNADAWTAVERDGITLTFQ